jgi:hypothetical protein
MMTYGLIEKQIKHLAVNNIMHKGNKSYLPQKNCVTCGKPFTWRKKWQNNWDEVKYCSDRCKKQTSKSKTA